MMNNIEKKVLIFLEQNALLKNSGKLLLAISGGADSVGLLELICSLRADNKIQNLLHIIHINHKLRTGDCDADEKYVVHLANKHKIQYTVKTINVKSYAKKKKLSIETAARNLRLMLFEETAKAHNCSTVLTAHHKNDNTETVLHRLLRGTAFKGLAGIRAKTIINGITYIRPLLILHKQEIEDYLLSKNISWQTDHTNADCRFKRNYIRNKLIPYLKTEQFADLDEKIFTLSQKCTKLYQRLENKAACADTKNLNQYDQLLQIEIVQDMFKTHSIGLQKFTNIHYNKISEFIKNAPEGTTINLPENTIIRKIKNSFEFVKQQKQYSFEPMILNTNGYTNLKQHRIAAEFMELKGGEYKKITKNNDNFSQWFDAQKITPPITVRMRKTGDKFIPLSRKNPQKVSKFLTSSQIDNSLRQKVFIIEDAKNILWLAPVRRSNCAKIDNCTKKVLKITIYPCCQ